MIFSLSLLAGCTGIKESREEKQMATEAPEQKRDVSGDTLIGKFCVKQGNINHTSGDTTTIIDTRRFIESSLQGSVKDIKKADYCVETGILRTDIKSLDSLRNLEFTYYILSDFNASRDLTEYKTRIEKMEYERITPATEAPHTNYHFTTDNKLIILSHYGMGLYYPEYDVKKYIGIVKEKK
jgi:hypothetical protein